MAHYFNKFIQAKSLVFRYPRTSAPVIKGISIDLYEQEFTAITGPNGGGKTTLGKLITGILKPSGGQVLINSQDSSQLSLGQISKQIGYLFQEPERQLFASTVNEELAFTLEIKGYGKQEITEQVATMLTQFDLVEFVDEPTWSLSRGEKQRLALATILINKPRFLVLDEPTTGLDQVRRAQLGIILDGLKAQGMGLAVISHDAEFIRHHADRVLEVRGGKIVSDTKTRLRSAQ